MCDPVSIGLGAVSAVGGVMQAQGQHNAQQAAVNRQNQIAQQQYQQQLRIAEDKDRAKKKAHTAELQAHAQAQNELRKQWEVNQLEANRALAVANQKKSEREPKVAFEMQAAVAQSIKAQGQLLSTGGTGQSFLLQSEQNQRELGFATAQLQQSLMDSDKVFGLEREGIKMDHYSRDAAAYSNLPAGPQARQAEYIPYKPIKRQGPSKMALMGAMIGSVAGGASTGIQSAGAIKEDKIFGAGYTKKYYG